MTIGDISPLNIGECVQDVLPALPLLLAFLATTLAMEITPGPNMGYLVSLTLANGKTHGFWTVVGIGLGLLIAGLAVALGLSEVLQNSQTMRTMLRWGGALFMLYLAWDAWRDAEIDNARTTTNHQTALTHMGRGLLTNLLNPKALAYYAAVLPRFVESGTHASSQSIALTLIYATLATSIHLALVLLAHQARRFIEHPANLLRLRKLMALAMLSIAIWFFVTAR